MVHDLSHVGASPLPEPGSPSRKEEFKAAERLKALVYAEGSTTVAAPPTSGLVLVQNDRRTSQPRAVAHTRRWQYKPALADIVLNHQGHLLEGRGQMVQEFAARVAYANRLAVLVGQALASGVPRSLEVRSVSSKMVSCKLGELGYAASWSSLPQGIRSTRNLPDDSRP